MLEDAAQFHIPRYREIPDVGLYLDQTVKYINRYLSALGCGELTPSMVSNYVKKGYLTNPVKKQYSCEQISRLLVIAVCKTVITMEDFLLLSELQERSSLDYPGCYDLFCDEFEAMLRYSFGCSSEHPTLASSKSSGQQMLRRVTMAAANIIYLQSCFSSARMQMTAEKRASGSDT